MEEGAGGAAQALVEVVVSPPVISIILFALSLDTGERVMITAPPQFPSMEACRSFAKRKNAQIEERILRNEILGVIHNGRRYAAVQVRCKAVGFQA